MIGETFTERTDREASAAKTERALLKGQLRYMMANATGRAWMWRHLGECGVYRSSFNTDAGVMAFAEGRRSVGLNLLLEIQTLVPELVHKMQQENSQRNEEVKS